jgi:hypothetical protein
MAALVCCRARERLPKPRQISLTRVEGAIYEIDWRHTQLRVEWWRPSSLSAIEFAIPHGALWCVTCMAPKPFAEEALPIHADVCCRMVIQRSETIRRERPARLGLRECMVRSLIFRELWFD